jgi:aminoglycoside 3-N-acetyltransferase
MAKRSEPRRIVTLEEIAADLERLDLRADGAVMVHASLGRIGWIVGGAETLVLALQRALPEATLVAQAGWELDPYYLGSWSEEQRAAYERCPTGYDRRTSAAAVADAGAFAERLRSWPGAISSPHPTARVVGLGPRAEWVAEPHPVGDAYGPDSPLARIVASGGEVLALGAPFTALSIFRYAERTASLPEPRTTRERVPVRGSDGVEWIEYDEIDLDRGAYPYETVLPDGQAPYDWLGERALGAGLIKQGTVGDAQVRSFDAAPVAESAVAAIRELFGAGAGA